MKKSFNLFLAVIAMLALSTAAFAGTAATGNVVSPTLTVSATVQDAVQLTLATGTTVGIAHCAISPASDYAMSFGNVDALGINQGCGVGGDGVFAPVTPGTTPAVYYTDYQMTPIWTGLTATASASITAFAPALEAGVTIQVPSLGPDQANTTGMSVATWNTIGATLGTASTVMSGGALSGAGANGKAVTRLLGLSVSPTATPATVNTIVTFTMTIK